MKRAILGNQQGVALIIALLVLLVLTVIGISGIGSTIMETKLSGTERVATIAFYSAAGGAEVGFNQLPDTNLYTGGIGSEGRYRSGDMAASSPQPLKKLGTITREGYEAG